MSYYVRETIEARIEGPHELPELARLVVAGTLGPTAQAVEATGQTSFQLKLRASSVPCWSRRNAPTASCPVRDRTPPWGIRHSLLRRAGLILVLMTCTSPLRAQVRVDQIPAPTLPSASVEIMLVCEWDGARRNRLRRRLRPAHERHWRAARRRMDSAQHQDLSRSPRAHRLRGGRSDRGVHQCGSRRPDAPVLRAESELSSRRGARLPRDA